MTLRTALTLLFVFCFGVARATEPAGTKPRKDAPPADVKNPVHKISRRMKNVAAMLRKLRTDVSTQEEQRKILEELDRLIKLARQSQSSSSPDQRKQNPADPRAGQQPKNASGSAMQNSRDVFRAIRVRPGRAAPNLREMWGRLPDAPRGEILQLLSEQLPMKYKRLLFRYFKALSEKK